jgi:diacylglycerol kinase (ATP)
VPQEKRPGAPICFYGRPKFVARRWLLLHNPHAGGANDELFDRAVESLHKLGDQPIVVQPEDGQTLLQCLESCGAPDRVLLFGGDGTVMKVVDSIMRLGWDVPIGLVPAGTGNFVARALGIPIDPATALQCVFSERIRRIDVGQCGDQFFVLGVGVGLAERFVTETDEHAKQKFGVLAYAWNMMASLDGPRLTFTIEFPNSKTLRAEGFGLVVANAMGLDGELPLGINILPDDGSRDVFVLKESGIWEAFRLAAQASIGAAEQDPSLLHLKSGQFLLQVEPRVPVQIDGDLSKEAFPMKFSIYPKRLTVLLA